MMTSGQKWVGTSWADTADASDPKIAHLLEHLFATKNVVITPTNDIGLEVAGILRESQEIWNGLPAESLLKTVFPQGGSIFTTLLELWGKESIFLTNLRSFFVDFTRNYTLCCRGGGLKNRRRYGICSIFCGIKCRQSSKRPRR